MNLWAVDRRWEVREDAHWLDTGHSLIISIILGRFPEKRNKINNMVFLLSCNKKPRSDWRLTGSNQEALQVLNGHNQYFT